MRSAAFQIRHRGWLPLCYVWRAGKSVCLMARAAWLISRAALAHAGCGAQCDECHFSDTLVRLRLPTLRWRFDSPDAENGRP